MKRWKQITYSILALMALLFVAFPAMDSRAAETTGSITYTYPVNGVTFKLYKVGKVENDIYSLTGDFKNYQVVVNGTNNDANKAAAETLASYAQRDKLTPLATATVSDGKVQFKDLSMAIYLLVGESAVKDNLTYVPEAILFSIPQTDSQKKLVWDINASGKYSTKKVENNETSISVEKIWSDSNHKSDRPSTIVAQLLQDGVVYKEVTLSDSNSWKYTWTNLPTGHVYKVLEKSTDSNYTVKVESTGTTYVITNTHKSSTSSSSTSSSSGSSSSGSSSTIPQTGQLWWPVGILLAGGIALILIGLIRRGRYEG